MQPLYLQLNVIIARLQLILAIFVIMFQLKCNFFFSFLPYEQFII
jgi:hypothetical protein